MWFDAPVGGFVPMTIELRAVLAISALFVFPIYLVAGPSLLAAAEAAAGTFF